MKRLFILFFLVFCCISFLAAEENDSESTQTIEVRYKLYPTKNVWTFLKLDTMTGRIWQVQYSIDGEEYRFETPLNRNDLCLEKSKKHVNGRFALYPTNNTYNFILLDQIDGDTYQIQWSGDAKDRLVLPISN